MGEGPAATPQAIQHANEQLVDLSQVKGTGLGGRITKTDVENWLAAQPQQGASAQTMTDQTTDSDTTTTPLQETTSGAVVQQPDDGGESEEPMTPEQETAAAKAEALAQFLQSRGYVRTGDLRYTSSTWGIEAVLELHDDGIVDVSTFREGDIYKPRFHNVSVEYLAGQIP